MPTRSPLHRPKAWIPRETAERERKQAIDANRPSSTERGYDGAWRKVRATHLRSHPFCSHPGCSALAIDVDHIEPISEHPERRLDPTNLRSFCRPHHSQRTALDQGFARSSFLRSATKPRWLKPSRIPVVVVCGPPAAGKTTFVRKHALSTDLVLDLDDLRTELSGLPRYSAGHAAWISAGLHLRNERLASLSYPSCTWSRCWLIVGEPTAAGRDWWNSKLHASSIVVCETDKAKCIERIRADVTRRALADQQIAAVSKWWTDYTRRTGDIIVRG
jgi:5-methylcytosine-specific restriction endonuclease McrA